MYKNRRLILGIIALVMVLALLLGLFASMAMSARAASSSEIRQQINNLKEEADGISAKRAELEAQIAQNKQETMDLV